MTPSTQDSVVITGMGAVSCLGSGVGPFWTGLVESRSGIGPIQDFDASALRNPEGGCVWNWDASALPPAIQQADRSVQFALAAAQEAMSDSSGSPPGLPSGEIGLVLATNFGGAGQFQSWASGAVEGSVPEPELFHQALMGTATDTLASELGVMGPRATLSLSCSSGAVAIGLAADWLRLGRASRMLAGGFDDLTLYSLAGLSCLRTVTTEKLRPFDRNRSGTVFGGGAGVVMLERESAALSRGATPLAKLSGWSVNNNAYHLTAPEQNGAGYLAVLRAATSDAGISPEAVDYVNAHGTGTRYNDPAETRALYAFLGERARETPVSAIKAAISHTMGAAGALECIATVLALRDGILPPTLNWTERDSECDLDCIPNGAREQPIRCAVSLSSGIGGNNAALVLERYD